MQGWRNNYTKYKEFFLNSYQEYTKKEEVKMFLEVILSLFAAAFFIFFALQPTVLTIGELLKTIKAKQEVIAKMDEKILNLEKARGVYKSNSDRIQLTNLSVPDNPAPETFSQQIEGLANLTQNTVNNVSVEQVEILGKSIETPKTDVQPLPESARGMPFTLNISSAGSFPSAASFLSNLKNLRRAIKIDKLTITSSVNESTQNLILAITGRGAYLGQETAPKQ